MDTKVRDIACRNARERELIPAPETQGQQQEQDQPAPFPTLSPDQGPAKEEVDEKLPWLHFGIRIANWEGVF
jgi:hypothetical protein